MSIEIVVLTVLWTVAVVLLVSSLITRNESLVLWGDVMLAVSFAVSSGMLIALKSYWIGVASAFPAARQTYVLIKHFSKVTKKP